MLKKIRNWFIDRIPLSTRLHIGRVLIVLLPLLTVSKPTFAGLAEALQGAVQNGILLFIEPVINTVLGIIAAILITIFDTISGILVSIIDYLILPGTTSLLFSTELQEIWRFMLNAANVLFFVAILAFAIMIITRSGGYNFKKAIAGLITAVVLANFSFIIVKVLIEVGDALKNSAYLVFNSTGATFSGIGPMWATLVGNPASNIFTSALNGGNFFEFLMLVIALVAASAIGVYVFFRLAFILVERAVRLAIAVVFAPFMFALGLLPHPDLQKMPTNWWSDTIRWVLVLPLAFLLIGIAFSLIPTDSKPMFDQIVDATHGVTNVGQLIFLIVPIAILFAAANVHQMLNVPISAATKFFTDTVPGMVQGAATFFGGALMRGAGMKLRETKVGGWAYRKMGQMKAKRQIAEGVYRTHKKTMVAEGNLETVKMARKSQKAYDKKIEHAIAIELNVDDSEVSKIKEKERKRYDRAKKIVDPRFAAEKSVVESKNMAAMVASGEMIKDNYDLYRTVDELEKSVEETMAKAKDAWNSGQTDKALEYEIAADTDMRTIKQMQVRAPGVKANDYAKIYNDLNERYKSGSKWLGKGGTPLEEIPQPKMRTKTLTIRDKKEKEGEEETAGSASEVGSDERLIKGWDAKEKYQEAQQAQQDAAQGVGDSGFTATVESVKNLEGSSAILQIIQQAAESDNPEALKNIASVSELLAKLSPDSEPKISDIQSRYGSDEDSIKSALQSEVGISEEDSKKAANLLSHVGVRDVSKVSAVADSMKHSQENREGLKAKVDYIHQVQATTQVEKEYQKSQTAGTTAKSTEANEQRIEATTSDAAEPYPIQEIRDDIQKATQQLRQIILQSSKDKPEQLRTYQRKLLGQIQHSYRGDLKKLTTKIFGKLKHLHDGSIIDSEDQIDRMTPKEIYKLLAETEASANKLSGGGK